MITNNILTEIGDKLFLNAQLAIFGTLQIDSIAEDLYGVTSDRYFTKKFKYSIDNLTWSEWIEFNLANLQLLNGSAVNILFLSFYYERVGTDASGILQVNNIQFSGDIVVQINDYTTTLQSIFSDLIGNDALTVSIANNLLKKVYQFGILPSYIERGTSEDEDFIAFWSAVCTFFSYIIGLANKFDDILNNKDFLSEYLRQKGVEFSKGEITLSDLQFIANNFLDEIRKRGTKNILLEKGYQFLDGSISEIDGEWIRLLSKNHYDEFLVEFVRKEHNGFYINQSCNLYNGTNESSQLNKTPENTADFIDLSKYVFSNPDTESYFIETVDGKRVLTLSTELLTEGGPNEEYGIGYAANAVPTEVNPTFIYNVDTNLDYELTFRVKRRMVDDVNVNSLKFGVLGFNLNNWYKPLSFQSIRNGVVRNFFYDDQILRITKTDEWYFVRCVIYSKGTALLAQPNDYKINVGYGENLRFSSSEDVYKIMPYIHLVGDDGRVSVHIHDFKFRPLVRGKNVNPRIIEGESEAAYINNPCFVQSNSQVIAWMKNNSDKTDLYVKNFIENYLLPYQKQLFEINLIPKIDDKQLLT